MMLTRSDLHQYQHAGVDFVVDNRRSFLALDLGLGKTVTVLTAISDLIDSFEVRKILVVAPLRVAKKTWPDEIKNWAHLKHLTYAVAVGDQKTRMKAIWSDAQIHIINVENLKWLVEVKGRKLDYDMLVIDESSMMKNRSTVRFKSARKLSFLANRVVLMSATPTPNSYLDLWAQAYILDGGQRLGQTLTGYKERYFKQLDRDGHKYALKKGAAEVIHEKMRDVMLSMKAADYLSMPDRFDRITEVELEADIFAAYEEFEKNLVHELPEGEAIEAVSAAALATKLMQFSNGQIYDAERNVHHVHDSKIEALKELVAEAQEPVLVAYTFKSDLARILDAFPNAVVLGKDMGVIDRWNRGEIDMLVTHPASAGHGLNLQHGGRYLFWFGPTYSLELHLQLNARLYRQGQNRPVVIQHIVSKGTIDEDIIKVLTAKNASQEGLLKAMKHRVDRVLSAQPTSA